MKEKNYVQIDIEVNGKRYIQNVNSNETLLDVLRERIGLKGPKKGCNSGQCGACTVILDGKSVNSCMVLAIQANGKKIITIEGLGKKGELHPIQEAYMEVGAVQCGFCTPGMILSTKTLLDKNKNPTEKEIKTAISGNLCRCTGYTKIVEAVKKASEKLNGL